MKEVYVFLTDNESITSKVKAGIVPAGYYDIQQSFTGGKWVTTYRYYEFDSIDDAQTVGPFIGEFRPQNARISECGALSIIVEEES